MEFENLNVVWSVGRLLAGVLSTKQFKLCRGSEPVKVVKVRGHATDMVEEGWVRAAENIGGEQADLDADFWRVSQSRHWWRPRGIGIQLSWISTSSLLQCLGLRSIMMVEDGYCRRPHAVDHTDCGQGLAKTKKHVRVVIA